MKQRGVVFGVVGLLLLAAAPANAQDPPSRYSLAGGCYDLAPAGGGDPVGKFRMQATALGRYVLYDTDRKFLAATASGTTRAAEPSNAADWQIDETDGGTFTLAPLSGRPLGGSGARFSFTKADGCPVYPEVELNTTGEPTKGPTTYGEVRGLIDLHMHMMAFEYFGGRVHCGRPWHRFGAPHALVDCPDHYPNGMGAIAENVFAGNPAGTHDPVGWPTFKDWPHHLSVTHEQSYYRWLERAWKGGLRVFTNLLVENAVLCRVFPLKKNSCDEMDSIRLQARRIREMEEYIDAQAGGPGKGFFRIVTDPFQARRVINEGKLAVILGMEISVPFGCGLYMGRPTCNSNDIDRGVDEIYDMGVRQFELVNKYDNALAGVAGDGGTAGVLTNLGNAQETGRFWDLETCDDHANHDHTPGSVIAHNEDALVGAILTAAQDSVPDGALPVYPRGPHCNIRGLSELGEHAVRRTMAKGMIFDPDHMSVRARSEALALVEAERYPGIISSHSWSTPSAYRRIMKLGGLITPYAGGSKGFVEKWRDLRPLRVPGKYFGFGFGADMGGFGRQGGPRGGENPVEYPFKSFDGDVTIDRQRSGERVFDINVDGAAHYGLYPDWLEDVRKIGGDEIIDDMARGAEAYLQMWERANGVPATRCRPRHEQAARGRIGRVRLGVGPEAMLRAVGQPASRAGSVWRWCVAGRLNRRARVVAAFGPDERVALVATTARGHSAAGVATGARANRLRRISRRFGRGLRIRQTGSGSFVYGVRRGRVSFVAAASREAARSAVTLRRYLRNAGLR